MGRHLCTSSKTCFTAAVCTVPCLALLLQDLAHTRFCLAPTGGGHGHRQLLVSFSGCVPLLIGEQWVVGGAALLRRLPAVSLSSTLSCALNTMAVYVSQSLNIHSCSCLQREVHHRGRDIGTHTILFVHHLPVLCLLLPGDYVYQPFEPELDWSRFSVTLPQSEIPRLHETLAKISDDEYRKLQVSCWCCTSTSTNAMDAQGISLRCLRWTCAERCNHPNTEH